MKILHFASCTGHGGDALAALALAQGQRQLGFDANLFIGTSPNSAQFVERAQAEGVPAAEVSSLPLLESIPNLTRVRAFRSLCASCRPRVVHIHTGWLAVRVADVVGARLCPSAVRVATLQWPYPWPKDSATEQTRWRRVAHLLDAVIVPSRISCAHQRRAGLLEQKVSVIANAVDIAKIQRGDGERIRKEFDISPSAPLVLFLARLESQKRPLHALKAFRAVSDVCPDAHMLVAGTGDLENECRRYIQEQQLTRRISMLGYRCDVADLMKAADIYILPTESESFGITLVEAMAASTPVIATRIAPLMDEVVPEGCGLLVSLDDDAGLSHALQILLNDSNLRMRMGTKARSEVQRRFDCANIARKHISLYNTLLARKDMPNLRETLKPVEMLCSGWSEN